MEYAIYSLLHTLQDFVPDSMLKITCARKKRYLYYGVMRCIIQQVFLLLHWVDRNGFKLHRRLFKLETTEVRVFGMDGRQVGCLMRLALSCHRVKNYLNT